MDIWQKVLFVYFVINFFGTCLELWNVNTTEARKQSRIGLQKTLGKLPEDKQKAAIRMALIFGTGLLIIVNLFAWLPIKVKGIRF